MTSDAPISSAHRRRYEVLKSAVAQLAEDIGIDDDDVVTPDQLLGINDIAEANETTPDLVRSWKARGQLPEPWATVGRTPVWLRRQFKDWERPGAEA